MTHDVEVLIIGAGMSGLGMAVQLIRQYGTRSFELIENSTEIGGTWWLNSYPGSGCDVPSHFFSYSFALNPNWSQKFAMQSEIHEYFKSVANQYSILPHVRFQTVVESAYWDSTTGTWLVTILDLNTKKAVQRRCKILISAVGALSIPKSCNLPGSSNFTGRIFHTAEWDHSFDWKDKAVVIIGNGCSATQIVPTISDGPGAANSVTQFSRQAHWLTERPNPTYSTFFKWSMKWIPFAMRLYRASIYWEKESDFHGLITNRGVQMRKRWELDATEYIQTNAPEKYREFLVPKTEVGCKRRVNDTGYLASLHRENVELVYDDPVQVIIENGVQTASGRTIQADAIILAHGFETQQSLSLMDIRGEGGITLTDHWNHVSQGSPSAYLGTCISGFPNFFVLMGPNTLSGHLSVIYTSECQINFTLRLIDRVLCAVKSSKSIFPSLSSPTDIVMVKPEAEIRDIEAVQQKMKGLVWTTGCSSWSIDISNGRNTAMFPDWQYKFWLQSLFVRSADFEYSRSSSLPLNINGQIRTGIALATLCGISSVLIFKYN